MMFDVAGGKVDRAQRCPHRRQTSLLVFSQDHMTLCEHNYGNKYTLSAYLIQLLLSIIAFNVGHNFRLTIGFDRRHGGMDLFWPQHLA